MGFLRETHSKIPSDAQRAAFESEKSLKVCLD
jgi:hypothetical protein